MIRFWELAILVVTVFAIQNAFAANITCGENEEYTDCAQKKCEGCELQLLDDFFCEPGNCKPGCKCKPGLFRDYNGNCVDIEQCKIRLCSDYSLYSECLPNECSNTCQEPNRAATCVLPTPQKCKRGCGCLDGYLPYDYRDPTFCFPEYQCNCDVPNSKFRICQSKCPPETCDKAVNDCPNGSNFCDIYLECGCKDGFVPTADGNCTDIKDCAPRKDADRCSDPYEVYSDEGVETGECGSAFPTLKSGCVCREGFWYASSTNRTCIRKTECPVTECGENAEWSLCGARCQRRCTEYFQNIYCYGGDCNPGCICKPGYYLDSNGKCVEPNECDPPLCSNGKNQEYTECLSCQDYCYYSLFNTSCLYSCYPTCKCKNGEKFNNNGECIPQDKCAEGFCYYANQEPVECSNYRCDNTCQEPQKGVNCTEELSCDFPTCQCTEGYLFDYYNYECVPEKECLCDDPNAWTVGCPQTCDGGTCELPERSNCRGPCLSKRGCQCKDGFYKSFTNRCKTLEQCGRCPGANEEYKTYASSCQPTCEQPNGEVGCDPYTYFSGCVCRDGYVRKRGICVPEYLCSCGPNEEFSPVAPSCQKNCAGQTSKCTRTSPGCVCREGFIRTENKPGSPCIPEFMCPNANPRDFVQPKLYNLPSWYKD